MVGQLPDNGLSWFLTNIRPIVPVPVKGQQGIFNIDIPLQYINLAGDELYDYWLANEFIRHGI